jgi:methylated-DNA-[protein]-cysteine S-methyltransferase
MRQFYDTFSTPLGDFSVALDANGAVIATAFGGLAELRERFAADDVVLDSVRAQEVRTEVTEYFAGKRQIFTVKLGGTGTPFQQNVWAALRRIPFGQTRSYGELADALERPGAARAIGRANATNPICLLVPCHRVIGGDGSLTGYAFGETIKHQLLAHETAVLNRTASAA